MEDMLVKYADRAFCYAVCAYLLWKDRTVSQGVQIALEAVKDAVTELKNAINLLAGKGLN